MQIDRWVIEKMALLARLRLTAEEVEQLVTDCRAILRHFDAIRDVDVSGVSGESVVPDSTPLREDKVAADRLLRSPAEMAPDWREGYFVLPRLPALDAFGSEGEGGSSDDV